MKAKNKEDDTEQEAYNQAVVYLAAKMYTVGELTEKLAKKGFTQPTIVAALRRLEELDFVNDQRYAEIFVENLKRYRDFGYYGIKQKLLAKRVPSEIMQNVLDEFYRPGEELQVAERFAGKLKRQGRLAYEKVARSLASRGFRTEIIHQVLQQLSAGKKKD